LADQDCVDQSRETSLQGLAVELQVTFGIPNPESLPELNESDMHRSLQQFARTNGFSFEGIKVCFSEDK